MRKNTIDKNDDDDYGDNALLNPRRFIPLTCSTMVAPSVTIVTVVIVGSGKTASSFSVALTNEILAVVVI